MKTHDLALDIGPRVGQVDALFQQDSNCSVIYTFGHGAGAGMRHIFMEELSHQLMGQGVATLRYHFPYAQAGGRRPDPPGVLEATVRAAIEKSHELAAGRPLIAGGKSMGGRMTSQALAKQPDARVKGVAFVGFPLHQPGKPGRERAAHLFDVSVPMLFLQGTRDTLARLDLIEEVCAELGERATLHVVDGADHSFAVPKRGGRSKEDVYHELAGMISTWAGKRTR